VTSAHADLSPRLTRVPGAVKGDRSGLERIEERIEGAAGCSPADHFEGTKGEGAAASQRSIQLCCLSHRQVNLNFEPSGATGKSKIKLEPAARPEHFSGSSKRGGTEGRPRTFHEVSTTNTLTYKSRYEEPPAIERMICGPVRQGQFCCVILEDRYLPVLKSPGEAFIRLRTPLSSKESEFPQNGPAVPVANAPMHTDSRCIQCAVSSHTYSLVAETPKTR
jgi:hypothetical protein